MAYTIKKRPHVREEVTVEGENGKTLTAHVDIDVHQIMTRYTGAVQKIKEAEDELAKLRASGMNKDNLGTAYAMLGQAVLNFFVLLFGEDQTMQIVEFYEGNHAEMLADFVPFIQDVIVPAIREAEKDVAGQYSAKKWLK